MSPFLLILLIALQLIIFAGLIYVFRRIFSSNVISATKHLEGLSQDFNQKQESLKKKLEEAERIYQEKLADAQEVANKIKEQFLKEAQGEKDKIISDAYQKAEEVMQQADKARQSLIAEIEQKIEERSLQHAVSLVQRALPERIRQEIHSRWFDDLAGSVFEQLERLHIPQDASEAKVMSAFALDDKQRTALLTKIQDKLKRSINLKEEIDPNIIAGVIINIDGLIFDGSLRFKIQEATVAK